MQVIETNASRNMVVVDLDSKLLQSNIMLINKELDSYSLNEYKTQLLYIQSQLTPEQSINDPIKIYIDSPGGDVVSGLGLYDMIELAKTNGYVINTINIGMCASLAAIILLSGTKGYRESLKHCRIMLHELSTGNSFDKISNLNDSIKEGNELQLILNDIIIKHTKYDLSLCKRKDHWMSAEEAIEYEIIDKIK